MVRLWEGLWIWSYQINVDISQNTVTFFRCRETNSQTFPHITLRWSWAGTVWFGLERWWHHMQGFARRCTTRTQTHRTSRHHSPTSWWRFVLGSCFSVFVGFLHSIGSEALKLTQLLIYFYSSSGWAVQLESWHFSCNWMALQKIIQIERDEKQCEFAFPFKCMKYPNIPKSQHDLTRIESDRIALRSQLRARMHFQFAG